MPKLAVLHLSDIHIHKAKDKALTWGKSIAESCFERLRDADACLIAITGDIAFSGIEDEYSLAGEKLLTSLTDAISSETKKPVYVSLTPGNHDCILKPANQVREIVIESVISNPEKAEDEDIVGHCTEVQKHFFSFSEKWNSPKPNIPSKLFWQQTFEIEGKKILISCLNASWMSRLPEKQGQMVFPIKKFDAEISQNSSLHLALIHHPLNWYAQDAYQALRNRLRLSCTAVLSGHEHITNAGRVEETLTGSSLFFEAAALQPHENNIAPGYSLHLFDLHERIVTTQEYTITNGVVDATREAFTQRWDNDSLVHDSLSLNQDFYKRITDSGGNFTHTAKEHLTLNDIYIWPDLRDWEQREIGRQRTQTSSTLPKQLADGAKIILYGDEKSGKSSLLFKTFNELIIKGFAPAYLNAPDVNVRSDSEAERQIKNAIDSQYINPSAAKNIQMSKRVLLIDDIDRLKSGSSGIHHLLNYAERHFAGICITASSSFEVTNLVSKEAMSALAPYKSYDLLKFGLKLRHQLIKKWCSLSGVDTKMQLDKNVYDVESIVNAVIGKQLVPEYPLYLLILLQSAEQHRHGELQNSGLSHYYHYLITKSLGSVGVKPSELDEQFNYLSHLAWYFQTSGNKELEFTELHIATQDYSQRFFTVEATQRLALLEKARILTRRGESYSFTYPYIYYYFVGNYLAKHITRPDIRKWIEESCKKLYLHERAHAIMFLTHHAKDSWVIELICNVLRSCFSENTPIELNGDTSFLNELVERSTQLTIEAPDVDHNQQRVREANDELSEANDESEEAFDELSFTSKWNLLHKTAEILGLILKNYYGSLERDQKKAMIAEVFDAPLRAIRLWLEAVSTDLEVLIQDIVQTETGKRPEAVEGNERKVKKKLFSLMGMVATGAIASAGSFVSTEKLKEDISGVVKNNPTNAYRLIEIASRLLRPGSIPMAQIKELAQELDNNPYAFGVLQSLGYMHMYMYHTDEQQKQALSQTLKISITARKNLALHHNKKMLK